MTRISEKAEEKNKKFSGTDKPRVAWAMQLHVEIDWTGPLKVAGIIVNAFLPLLL